MDSRTKGLLLLLLVVVGLAFGAALVAACGSNGKKPFCGDGKVNQPWEQCDRKDGVPKGYYCNDKCELVKRERYRSSCEEAVQKELLIGEIDGTTATVTNKDRVAHVVTLVSYQMYESMIDDQTYFDSQSVVVKPGKTVTLRVKVPDCAYQLDLVCGKPIKEKAPYYDDRMIDFRFSEQEEFCTQTRHSPSRRVSATLSIAPYYPKNASYVFECTANNFTATNYYWYFGDDEFQPNSTNQNVYHTYAANGDYTVACTATDGVRSATDVLPVSVTYYQTG
jgi:hypothetical protein